MTPITLPRAVVEQALEALIHMCHNTVAEKGYDGQRVQNAIDALRSALAQQEQEPVADAETWLRNRYGAARGHHAWRELIEAFNAGRTAAQEQGPVAWTTKGQIAAMENGFLHYIQGRVPRFVNPSENDVALYTHPPRREWQSLTEEEMDEFLRRFARYELIRAVEAALKERNT
jgi:hypothetical protein